ncbi:box a-binding factor-related [Anaeramoeba flamelloides]|uniref:Box a-binding factor-related n=1 Tax=Anaeramoeba flamelloides TaxID=1746091 RepID=A0AAV7YG43_9EUKA|nr:box a-binding factor-related [Anaeramoeba flamelloides]
MSKSKICSNPDCKATTTPIWRRIDGNFYCNACGMYKKRHNGKDRPISETQNSGQKKKRICKIVTINRPSTYSDHSSPIYSDGMNSQNNEEGYSVDNNPRRKTRTVFRFKSSPRHENQNISNSPNDQQQNLSKDFLSSPRSPRSPIASRSPIIFDSNGMNRSKQTQITRNTDQSQGQMLFQKQKFVGNQMQPQERSDLKSSNLFSPRFFKNTTFKEANFQSSNGLEIENENESLEQNNTSQSDSNSSGSMSVTDGEEWIEEENEGNISDQSYDPNSNESDSQNDDDDNEIPVQEIIGNNQKSFFRNSKNNNFPNQLHFNFEKINQQQQQQNSFFHNQNNYNSRNNNNNKSNNNNNLSKNSKNIFFNESTQSSSKEATSSSFPFFKNNGNNNNNNKRPKQDFQKPKHFNQNFHLKEKRMDNINYQNRLRGCQVENKIVNFRKGDCVAIWVPQQPEIYAVILDFKKSSKTQQVYIQVRWLLPKVHPFHQNHFNFNTRQLKRNDFDLGEFEKILQPIGSIKRKLNFTLVD